MDDDPASPGPEVVFDGDDEVVEVTDHAAPSRSSRRLRRARRRRPDYDPNDSVIVVDSELTPVRPKRPRIVGTVDLSDAYVPTPVIQDVIVVEPESPAPAVRAAPAPPAEEASQPSPNSERFKTCPICMDQYSSRKPMASTFCGHVFCRPCMKTVKTANNKCPTCRKSLRGKGYHSLFL